MKYQNKFDISNYIYIFLILFIFLLSYNTKAQSFLKQEISIVEYNTNWNKNNHIKGLEKLKNCKTYNISLCNDPHYMEKYNIKTPTIILFNNGEEVKRYLTNILFTFDVNYKNLQADVDSILLLKFN